MSKQYNFNFEKEHCNILCYLTEINNNLNTTIIFCDSNIEQEHLPYNLNINNVVDIWIKNKNIQNIITKEQLKENISDNFKFLLERLNIIDDTHKKSIKQKYLTSLVKIKPIIIKLN